MPLFLQKDEKFQLWLQAIVLIKSRPAAFKIRQGRKDGAVSLDFLQVLFPIMGKMLPASGGFVTFASLSDSIFFPFIPKQMLSSHSTTAGRCSLNSASLPAHCICLYSPRSRANPGKGAVDFLCSPASHWAPSSTQAQLDSCHWSHSCVSNELGGLSSGKLRLWAHKAIGFLGKCEEVGWYLSENWSFCTGLMQILWNSVNM